MIKELEERYSNRQALGQYIAAVYAGLGDNDQAFSWLGKAKPFRSSGGKTADGDRISVISPQADTGLV